MWQSTLGGYNYDDFIEDASGEPFPPDQTLYGSVMLVSCLP
jgi:hypothetical protein